MGDRTLNIGDSVFLYTGTAICLKINGRVHQQDKSDFLVDMLSHTHWIKKKWSPKTRTPHAAPSAICLQNKIRWLVHVVHMGYKALFIKWHEMTKHVKRLLTWLNAKYIHDNTYLTTFLHIIFKSLSMSTEIFDLIYTRNDIRDVVQAIRIRRMH